MLKLPPPVWAVLFVLAGVGICRTLGWPPGPHSALAGAVLAVFGWIPPIWAIGYPTRESLPKLWPWRKNR